MNAKLSDADVRVIRRCAASDAFLAKVFGVKRLAILRARTGQTFQHVKVKPTFRLLRNLTKEK